MRYLILLLIAITGAIGDVPVLKVGYVGHDHQSALYVACLEWERTKADCGTYLKEVTPKKHYELIKDGQKIADVELMLCGGGSKMPTMMAQGHFEVGFGGVAAVAFFTDKGSPMKIISPLHTKGDMLVLQPDNPISSWEEFVAWVRKEKRPIRIGFKNPVAVAKLIFERALEEEGLTYTSDKSDQTKDVLMILLKGEKNLVPGLQNKIIDGYVSNNPWCAIAESKGVGKIVADLNELPPGIWKDHPCCCIAATDEAMKNKKEIIKEFLKLIILATQYANEDPEMHAQDASKWIGTSLEVERKSLPTSGFTTNPTEKWKNSMQVWIDEMNRLGKLKGKLKGKKGEEVEAILYDFSALKQAAQELKEKGLLKTWY
ncbi:nitrate ABC transporter substrate-binding protein [candidate division WOR-3 bacterium]|uniref:Nitrate ABC transporter substrate-binding protein n=1 Tax=candidate division WOR-3 bacterium TaxID=2052148 RepID=A0A660SHE5_UNCW3|nr:MAG: nitrate ABC transporter substrate-binding protein [candidate division WOR-3 bacterium]